MTKQKEKNHNRPITLVPLGGVAKRIRTIASFVQAARYCERRLEVIWFSDDTLPCPSDRLFTLAPKLAQADISIRQATWRDYFLNLPPLPANLYTSFPFVLTRYDQTFTPAKTQSMLREHKNHLWELLEDWKQSLLIATTVALQNSPGMYNLLEPSVEVRNIQRSRMSGWGENVVGVHINRNTHGATYRECPTELIIDRMQEMIEQDASVQFFIATTSKDERERLATIFRKRIFAPYTTADPHSVRGAIEGYGELLALSQSRLILSTKNSSFSAVAAEIGQAPIENLGVR